MSMLERLIEEYNKNDDFVAHEKTEGEKIIRVQQEKSDVKLTNTSFFENESKNVDFVACASEIENHLGSSSSKNTKNNISLACASNKVNKIKLGDCDNCPAAGFWDCMGPGKWCFHSAYFLGKTGKPISCITAKKSCPIMEIATN